MLTSTSSWTRSSSSSSSSPSSHSCCFLLVALFLLGLLTAAAVCAFPSATLFQSFWLRMTLLKSFSLSTSTSRTFFVIFMQTISTLSSWSDPAPEPPGPKERLRLREEEVGGESRSGTTAGPSLPIVEKMVFTSSLPSPGTELWLGCLALMELDLDRGRGCPLRLGFLGGWGAAPSPLSREMVEDADGVFVRVADPTPEPTAWCGLS
mmetsp:Transcript_28554/g.57118  ORF Transcript_28554/g.57118 Transcript_28554/m.57118 type:complete len:207 (-) Transcript_28554:124-744(-)